MNPKTLSACFLLVLLSAVGHTEAQFQKQVVGAMQPGQCREKMAEIHEDCFHSDTFIVTDEAKINALCQGVDGDMKTFSKDVFKIVDCTRKTEDPCVYEGVVHTKSNPTFSLIRFKTKSHMKEIKVS
uniref:Ribonuclease A-domain domain-containing protein n=1 Tax=Oryzias latipes TaxID=8090 RepID=A0A3P9KNR6_ORYLA